MTASKRYPHTRQSRDAVATTPPAGSTGGSPSGAGNVDPEERSRRIAEAAYFLAERRGFCPGCEVQDWVEAEKTIDKLLSALPACGNATSGQDEARPAADSE